jgi:hypothetical protein
VPIIAQLSIGHMRVVRMSPLLVLSVSFRATATVSEGSGVTVHTGSVASGVNGQKRTFTGVIQFAAKQSLEDVYN